jgi:heat shock protein HtpX
MVFFKRFFLFAIVNIAVVLTISFITSALGLNRYYSPHGLNYTMLMQFCLIWGMTGSFISLLLSKVIAKWTMNVQVIDPKRANMQEQELLQMVRNASKAAGLPVTPEVGIYPAMELNAFATGPSSRYALVAVSEGLLRRMSRDEIEGVIGHEVAHIANGDMVTMTLLQGVMNAFVMFFSRVLTFVIVSSLSRNSRDDNRPTFHHNFLAGVIQFVLELMFMILGSLVVAWFSRLREYRADQGGATYAGRDKMIAALQALKRNYEALSGEAGPAGLQALQISNKRSLLSLFSTHPPLEDRINRLQHRIR